MAKKQEKNSSYKVGSGTSEIRAAVDVGAGQKGTVSVALDRKSLRKNAATPVAPVKLGAAEDVEGKLLIVETAVTDVIGMTNKMSVTVRLTGGPSPKNVPDSTEVDDGETVLFQTFILLKE
jgi:hypothetical protein